MNLSFVIGNLGSDAKVVENNGQQFITLSIADSRKFKKQDGTEVTSTNWVDAIISDPNHPVLPYLKQGVKVAIIGQSTLRVYSSKKDRCMKAGQTIHVLNIELCGGSSDDVPRQLVDPNSGVVYDTKKLYWIPELQGKTPQGYHSALVDSRANAYVVDSNGFVTPEVQQGQENNSTAADGGATSASAGQKLNESAPGSSSDSESDGSAAVQGDAQATAGA